MRALLVILALSAWVPEAAFAARLYRCAGYVQYSPCPKAPPPVTTSSIPHRHPTSFPINRPASAARKLEPHGQFRYQGPARVSNTKLTMGRVLPSPAATTKTAQPITRRRDGIWTGVVEGSGMVALYLEILGGEGVAERRYMGKVLLADTSTTFRFISVLPHGNDWRWRISARVES